MVKGILFFTVVMEVAARGSDGYGVWWWCSGGSGSGWEDHHKCVESDVGGAGNAVCGL